MAMHNLMRNVAIIHRTSQVTGTTADKNDAGIDTTPYTGVAWLVSLSTLQTTGASIKLQESASSGFSTSAVSDLTGTSISMTTTIEDGVAILDLYKPGKQWVRLVYVSVNTSDVFDSIIALGYLPKEAPVTHSTADLIGAEYHSRPSTGTA
ncbi:hypothetical protein LCGC14_0313410 [marine sediment metagenome]|uniref:Uncharacterized protein n=1 Tax=marine sediment metagenome TaxID=412755 RepID=A0A0F9TRW0_9ZZZZ